MSKTTISSEHKPFQTDNPERGYSIDALRSVQQYAMSKQKLFIEMNGDKLGLSIVEDTMFNLYFDIYNNAGPEKYVEINLDDLITNKFGTTLTASSYIVADHVLKYVSSEFTLKGFTIDKKSIRYDEENRCHFIRFRLSGWAEFENHCKPAGPQCSSISIIRHGYIAQRHTGMVEQFDFTVVLNGKVTLFRSRTHDTSYDRAEEEAYQFAIQVANELCVAPRFVDTGTNLKHRKWNCINE